MSATAGRAGASAAGPEKRTTNPIAKALGTGRPLESGVRSRMEPVVGSSLAFVRVHTDGAAAALADASGASAMTAGGHIAFGEGQYRPRTPWGDGLIAHELAHAVQQGDDRAIGGSDTGALERDANTVTAGAIASLWSGGLLESPPAAPQMRSGLRLSRCDVDPKDAYKFKVTPPTVTEADQKLIDRLQEVPDLYQRYHIYEQLSPKLGKYKADKGLDIDRELRDLGWAEGKPIEPGITPALYEFSQAIKEFLRFFQGYSLQTAGAILDENEELIRNEVRRYSTGEGLKQLTDKLGPLREKVEIAEAKWRIVNARPIPKMEGRGAVPPAVKEDIALGMAARQADDEARTAAKSMAGTFPILADPELNLSGLVHGDEKTVRGVLQAVADARISDINKSRVRLADDPELVWQMENAIARAKKNLPIAAGSVTDLIIKDKLTDIKINEIFKNLLLGALAIGAGLLTAGGGTVGVLAAVGGAGLSGYQAGSHIKEFLTKQAASGTALDRANALTADDPSGFWLAIDIATAILDLALAAKAMKSVLPVAKEAVAATETAEKAAKMEQLKDAVKKLEGLATPADAEALAKKVVASAEHQAAAKGKLASLPAAEAAALRAIAKGDEAIAAGLAQMGPAARGQLLKAFSGEPGWLQRLGRLIDEAPQVANSVDRLQKALPAKQFETIIAKYMRTDSKSAPNILKAMADAGVSDEALASIAKSLEKVKSPDLMGRRFAQQIIEKTADALPGGAEGIKRLHEITAGLHPNQSGTIFERWASKNIFGRDAQRFSTTTAKLKKDFASAVPPPKFSQAKIATDDVAKTAKGELAIVDYKHYQNAREFGEEALTQLDNYREMLRLGAKNDAGEVFRHVQYLFSTEAAATKNAATIRASLGNNVTIFFVDANGVRKVLP